MAMTYTQLKTLVQNYTENTEATFVANIDSFTDMAEKRIYNDVGLPVERKIATNLTTTIGVATMALPTDFLAPYSFSVTNPSTGAVTFLLNKDPEFINEAYPITATTGTPAHYALQLQSLASTTALLGPTPDAAYATTLNYYYYPASIVTATNTWLGDNYPMALLYGVLREAAAYMKSEPDTVQGYEASYQEALESLRQMGEGKDRRDAYRSRLTRVPVK